MATIKIRGSKNGRASFNYVLNDKRHNKDTGIDRCLRTRVLGALDTDQIAATWDRWGKVTDKDVQVYSLIQSFSDDEFSADNPEDVDRVFDIGVAVAQALYPDRQALVATQADGTGGKLHNHIIVNNVDNATGKSLRGKRKNWADVKVEHDKVLENMGAWVLPDQPTSERTPTPIGIRKAREKDPEKYWYRDHLADMIDKSAEISQDMDDFIQNMADFGVSMRINKKNKGISYRFTDKEDKNRRVRASKIGTGYQYSGILTKIEEAKAKNKAKEAEASRVYSTTDKDLEDRALLANQERIKLMEINDKEEKKQEKTQKQAKSHKKQATQHDLGQDMGDPAPSDSQRAPKSYYDTPNDILGGSSLADIDAQILADAKKEARRHNPQPGKGAGGGYSPGL